MSGDPYIDLLSPTWRFVTRWAEEQIEASRTALEQPAPELSSNLTRGRLRALRDLLQLAEPRPEAPRFASGQPY